MPSRTLVMRVSALALGLAGGGVYAASQGLLPMPGSAPDTSVAPPAAQAEATMPPPAPTAVPDPVAVDATPVALTARPAIAVPAMQTPPETEATVEVTLPDPEPPVELDVATPTAPTPDSTIPAAAADSASVQPDTPPLADAPALSPLGLPCGLTLEATAQPTAMVGIDIMAPCQPDTALRIEHSGLTIAARTDPMGLLTLDVPAFETPAFFTVRMADGAEASLLVPLPDLRDFDRIGIAWTGTAALDLHAMEFGARFGDEGHVWAEAPRRPDAALSEQGGFLTQLGDPDMPDRMLAQVYTLPRATLSEGNSVTLSIDAEITAANCAQPAAARTLRVEAAGEVEVTPLSFTHPGCDAVGDFLVLQNLLGDLRLASN